MSLAKKKSGTEGKKEGSEKPKKTGCRKSGARQLHQAARQFD